MSIRLTHVSGSPNETQSARGYGRFVLDGRAIALLASVLFMATELARADAVTEWNEIMQTTASVSDPAARIRTAAVTQVAVFEAVNSILGHYEPYLREIPASPDASPEAAVIAAAHRALMYLHPESANYLDAARAQALAKLGDEPGVDDGIAVGDAAADAILALRSDDGFDIEIPHTPGSGPGEWIPTPPSFIPAFRPGLGRVAPFAIAIGRQFRAAPPPRLHSRAYARDYNEVRAVGEANSSMRSRYFTDVSRFYAATDVEAIHFPAARQVAIAQGTTLAENARIFALLSMAIWDAAVACFESKYHFNLWRPITAIAAADVDGNPRTDPDASWRSFVENPPFPSYPSGHASLGAAARAILEHAFGKGGHAITLQNPTLPEIVLHYERFKQITDDIDDARVYGGVHFRFDQEGGVRQGWRIGKHILRHQLRPVHRRRD
jgi:hypothetical protein